MGKINIKRILVFVLCITLCFGVCSCDFSAKDSKKINVVATGFIGYDFARAIFGNIADISMLVKPGVEIHSFDPSPTDIISISEADVFICVGGESEEWIESLDDDILNKGATFVMMDCVLLENEEDVLDFHKNEEYDEHIWTSPKNSILILQQLCKFACDNFSQYSDLFSTNLNLYVNNLKELDIGFCDFFNTHDITMCFGDRFPFLYFVKQYNVKYCAAYSGCSSNLEPSPNLMAKLINTVQNESIPIIFYLELSNHQIADSLSEQTGVGTELFYSCQNISIDDFDSGQTYYMLMNNNLNLLKKYYK